MNWAYIGLSVFQYRLKFLCYDQLSSEQAGKVKFLILGMDVAELTRPLNLALGEPIETLEQQAVRAGRTTTIERFLSYRLQLP